MPYRPGDWWMICDVCGLKYLHSKMKKRYDDAWVCSDDWEPKHPQEIDRILQTEDTSVPVARPRPTDIFDSKLTKDHI